VDVYGCPRLSRPTSGLGFDVRLLQACPGGKAVAPLQEGPARRFPQAGRSETRSDLSDRRPTARAARPSREQFGVDRRGLAPLVVVRCPLRAVASRPAPRRIACCAPPPRLGAYLQASLKPPFENWERQGLKRCSGRVENPSMRAVGRSSCARAPLAPGSDRSWPDRSPAFGAGARPGMERECWVHVRGAGRGPSPPNHAAHPARPRTGGSFRSARIIRGTPSDTPHWATLSLTRDRP